MIGKLGSSRERWNLPVIARFITRVVKLNLVATLLTFIVSILCGLSPTKSNLLHSILGCTYLSHVAFTPTIISFLCCCSSSRGSTKQIPGHIEFIDLFLWELLAERVDGQDWSCNSPPMTYESDDGDDSRSNLMEGRIYPGMQGSDNVKDLTATTMSDSHTPSSSTRKETSRYTNIRSQPNSNKNRNSPRICIEKSLLAEDQQLITLLQQMCYNNFFPTMIGTVFGVSICSILNILDWGSQLQRWPVPIILGTTVGHACGTAYVVTFLLGSGLRSTVRTYFQHIYSGTGVGSKME